MKVLRLRISGRVQGVGFRAFVADEAQTRGLAGWARNRADRTVEALVAGEDDVLAAMIEACRKGPRGARVDAVAIEEASERDLAGRSGFEILPTR